MPQGRATTAVIAAADMRYRQDVRRLIEPLSNLQILGEAADGRDALALLLRHRPDVAILDVLMPLYTGKEVLDEVLRRNLPTRVLLMTAQDCPDYLTPSFWCDAPGYLYKGDGLEDWIVPALKAVIAGHHFVSPTPLAILRDRYAKIDHSRSLDPPLTRFEEDMLVLTVRGKSDKEMAASLGTTVRTVEKRKARLRKKFGVNSTVELAVFAAQRLFESSDRDLRPD